MTVPSSTTKSSTATDRVHMMRLVTGALESRLTHVHFLDTEGGEELGRFYRHRRAELLTQLHHRPIRRQPARPPS